jgi:hypothetical protein
LYVGYTMLDTHTQYIYKLTSNRSPGMEIMPAVPDCCSVAQAIEASIAVTSSEANADAIYMKSN